MAAPIVSNSTCGGDCACGSVSAACEAPAPAKKGLFSCFHHKKKPAPAPAADCGCGTATSDCGCAAPATCGCAAPAAAPVSTCSTDCACGSVSSAREAPAPAKKGFFHKHHKKPAPAPAADCGCGAAVSTGCGCGSTMVGAPINAGPINHGPVYNPAPLHGYSSSPIISNPGHGAVVTPNAGTVISNPGTGSPVISTPASTEPLKAMPKSDPKPAPDKKGASIDVPSTIAPAGAKVETESKNPFELARRYENRVGHDAEYSKLTGQLFYVHTDGGLWVLRYAPLSEEDRNGGSVILSRDRMMNSYKEGDLITVEGEIISQKGSAHLGGPLYRVQQMILVDRPVQ